MMVVKELSVLDKLTSLDLLKKINSIFEVIYS
jgi:hypothetical protein